MKRFGLLGSLICLTVSLLIACQPQPLEDTPAGATETVGIVVPSGSTPSGNTLNNETNTVDNSSNVVMNPTEDRVTFISEQIDLSIAKPSDWESFPTEYGIVIGERFGSVATAGVLEGLMTYVFVTPLQDFTLSAAQDNANLAQLILNSEILSDPVYTANLAFTNAEGFTWDGYDAAYYLLSGDDGNATVVIGVAIPEEAVLLSCSVSAPLAQRGRLREALPTLLDGLTLNAIRFSGAALDSLPTPLTFPEYTK